MRCLFVLFALIVCIAYASAFRRGKSIVKAYPYRRNTPNLSRYEEYPLVAQDHESYYMHNYLRTYPNDGYPYFGYPYGECSSCRKYQTEEVAAVKPDCPCSHQP